MSELARRWETDIDEIFELLSETKEFQRTGELSPIMIARFEDYVRRCADAGGIEEADAFKIIYNYYQVNNKWIPVDEFYPPEGEAWEYLWDFE